MKIWAVAGRGYRLEKRKKWWRSSQRGGGVRGGREGRRIVSCGVADGGSAAGWKGGEWVQVKAVNLSREGKRTTWAVGIWVPTGGGLAVGWVKASEAKGLRDHH